MYSKDNEIRGCTRKIMRMMKGEQPIDRSQLKRSRLQGSAAMAPFVDAEEAARGLAPSRLRECSLCSTCKDIRVTSELVIKSTPIKISLLM